eukprot:m51a1_g1331 putative adenylate guanylate cyclase (636) ;mRNA; r:290631-292935
MKHLESSSSSTRASSSRATVPVFCVLVALVVATLSAVTAGTLSTMRLEATEASTLMLATQVAQGDIDPDNNTAFLLAALRFVYSHRASVSGSSIVQPSSDPTTLLACGVFRITVPGGAALFAVASTNHTTLAHCFSAVDPVSAAVLFPLFCDTVPTARIPFWGENRTAASEGLWTPVFSVATTDIDVSFRVSTFSASTGAWIGYVTSDVNLLGLAGLLEGLDVAYGLAFLVERDSGLFLGSTDSGLNSTWFHDSMTSPLAVADVRSSLVHEAHRAVLRNVCVSRPVLAGIDWTTIGVSAAIWASGVVIAGLFVHLRTRACSLSKVREVRTMQETFLSLKTAMHALSKFLPAPVVLDILHSNTGKVERFMRTKYLSIMFVDLAGFTTLSESVPLATLNSILDTYFDEFGQFIGDGIMVLYGAPLEIEDPVGSACATALELSEAMAAVNERFKKSGLPPLNFRVGLHCGAVLVGNLGSHSRINYTVCGDCVNVASRMEQLGKSYGVSPLVSGAIQERVADKYVCVLLDIVALRGKSAFTKIYHVLCPYNRASADIVALQAGFGKVHELICSGHIEEAAQMAVQLKSNPQFSGYHTALDKLHSHIQSGELRDALYSAASDTSPKQLGCETSQSGRGQL